MKKINKITVNTSKLPTTSTTRRIEINGDDGAVFNMQINSSAGRYYDFKTETFAANYTSSSTLSNVRIQGKYTRSIIFPAAASGDTYTISIYASPHFDTEMNTGGTQQKTQVLWKETINQHVGNKTITFTWQVHPLSPTLNLTGLGNLAQSTGSANARYTDSNAPTISFDGISDFKTNAVAGTGLKLLAESPRNVNEFGDEVLYWETGNYTANGGGTGSTSLVLTSVDDLAVGMQVSYINSVYQSELRQITEINYSTKTLTLDGVETWSDTHVIKFRSYGSSLINKTAGLTLASSSYIAYAALKEPLVLTLRGDIAASQTDIPVNGTDGAGVGATVRGRVINNNSSTSACTITEVSGHASNGSITIANGETFAADSGTNIHVYGTNHTATIKQTASDKGRSSGDGIKILRYPTSNTTIYIDLNKIFAPGAHS